MKIKRHPPQGQGLVNIVRHYKGLRAENPDTWIEYNATPNRAFELFRADANDSSTLRIKLITTRLVSPGDQTAGVLVSTLGLSLPIVLAAAEAPIILFFYYFPNVKSMTELSLSEDINGASQPRREFMLASPGFLKSPEKQIKKHTVTFEGWLKLLVRQIEKQAVRKKTNQVAKHDSPGRWTSTHAKVGANRYPIT